MFICGVDPGSTNVGVALFDINDHTFSIENIITYNLDLTIVSVDTIWLRYERLDRYIRDIFCYYRPYFIGIESGFISHFRPQAYGPISQSIYIIKHAYIDITKSYNIRDYPPKYVKKYICTGDADKNDMLLHIRKYKDITKHIDVDNLTEHEIDALSICYLLYNELKQYPELMF